MSVERLARALGVWSDGPAVDLVGLARKHGAALIKVSDEFRVWTPTALSGLDQHWRLCVDPHDVDEGTALIFLLAFASGLDGGGYSHTGGCGTCRGHGTVLGALWPKLEALVAERLKRLETPAMRDEGRERTEATEAERSISFSRYLP